ncbi:MAG TPA: hypothetical protein VF050_11240, partial [Moraxellaceae bacterium]
MAFIALAFLGWQRLAGAPTDLSGVWILIGSNTTLVLEKQGADYRLSLGGRRLTVKDVDRDNANHQINLTVVTDSGLLATWSLSTEKDGESRRLLYVDRDGFARDPFMLQRELTDADRARLAKARPARQPLWSPSFDCGKAATDVERMICSDAELAEMDKHIAAVVSAADAIATQKASQPAWIESVRNSCTT